MSRDRQTPGRDATPPGDLAIDREQSGDSPAWATLGDDSVPLHDKTGRADAREREVRLRLVTGRRRKRV